MDTNGNGDNVNGMDKLVMKIPEDVDEVVDVDGVDTQVCMDNADSCNGNGMKKSITSGTDKKINEKSNGTTKLERWTQNLTLPLPYALHPNQHLRNTPNPLPKIHTPRPTNTP